jgi:hypothetical protein
MHICKADNISIVALEKIKYGILFTPKILPSLLHHTWLCTHHGLNVVRLQFIYKIAVIIDSCLINNIHKSSWQNARPWYWEPVQIHLQKHKTGLSQVNLCASIVCAQAHNRFDTQKTIYGGFRLTGTHRDYNTLPELSGCPKAKAIAVTGREGP